MSKRKRSAREGDSELEINMTPMIDIVFQLLIFFVLTAKFIKFEGELLSYLPKDRGTNAGDPQDLVEPLIIFLRWQGDPVTGKCVAITTNYQPPEGGVVKRYTFPEVDPRQQDPAAVWPTNERVKYNHPSFANIKAYMEHRQGIRQSTGSGKFPVTINFDDRVPVQMVVNLLDICQQLKITDFAINAEGVEIN